MDICKCSTAQETTCALAIATVPMQPWETPFDPGEGLKQGTIFPCLVLPFYVTGGDCRG